MGAVIVLRQNKNLLSLWPDEQVRLVSYEALFMLWSRGQRGMCTPPCQKRTLPWASSSSGISQQEAKTHSCYPVFPLLSVEDIQQGREWLGRPWFMNDKKDKMGEEGEKNPTGLIDLIPLETQTCVAIILLYGQISKNSQLWEIILPSPKYSITTRHWPQ